MNAATHEEDLCGCCDRNPCVHEDEPTAEEIDSAIEQRVRELNANFYRGLVWNRRTVR